jgi:hypothetical protein
VRASGTAYQLPAEPQTVGGVSQLSEPFNHGTPSANDVDNSTTKHAVCTRQRLVGRDAVVFPATKSMDFIVSETTDSLSTTWRAPHFLGRIWHALTRG